MLKILDLQRAHTVPMKEVSYKGLGIWVPQSTNFLAVDNDGCLYAYEKEPKPVFIYHRDCWESDSSAVLIAEFDPISWWADSLQEI